MAGYNSAIIVQEVDPVKAKGLIGEINKMNAAAFNNSELVAAYMWGIEEYTVVKPVE